MKRTFARAIIATFLPMVLTGCISLSSTEKTRLAELQAQGIRIPQDTIKHPALGGALNILPGFGNFYNAIGTNESEQWLVGFLNLLTWPISVIWGIPEGAIDAITINKRETVYYYTYGPGAQELAKKGVTPAPETTLKPVAPGAGTSPSKVLTE